MIYHVTTTAAWDAAKQAGEYVASSLGTEGFIHLSRKEQVQGVLERYYAGQSDLVLLHVEETLLTAPLKYERAPSVNEDFPHVYGPINIDAVVQIEILEQWIK